MKPVLISLWLLVLPHMAVGQGQVVFENRLPAFDLVAPVYGINPLAPSIRMSGNATTIGGTVDYTGVPLLSGNTYTASLWGARLEISDVAQFELLSTRPFRTSVAGAGFWSPPPEGPVLVPFVSADDHFFNAQVRVWDNQNGTITSWAQALANPSVGGMGYSEVFTLPVVSRDAPAAYLQGLTSFNLTVVPEPSALALGLLGAAGLWLFERRHPSHQHRPR